ncbi:MAG: hypothetical protein QNJ97_15760 [Myxococcota bacterium]|nr:hypothetical protein [Myxococcota bacterium]
MKRCVNCNAVLEEDRDTCAVCGTPHVSRAARQGQNAEYLGKDRWTFSGIALGDKQVGKQGSASKKKTTIDVTTTDKDKIPQPTKVLHVLRESKLPRNVLYQDKGKDKDKEVRAPSKQGATLIGGVTPAGANGATKPGPQHTPQSKHPKADGADLPDLASAVQTQQWSAPIPVASPSPKAEPLPQAKIPHQDLWAPDRKGLSGTRMRHGDVGPRLSTSMGISSGLLMLLWFVPDVWSIDPVFPMHLLGEAQGLELLALLAQPFFGALVLALLIAPFRETTKASLGLVFGILVLLVPMVASDATLPYGGAIALVGALVATIIAIGIFFQLENAMFGHFALTMVPLTLLGTAVFVCISRGASFANIAVFKAPIALYAGMLLCAGAATVLIAFYRMKSKEKP